MVPMKKIIRSWLFLSTTVLGLLAGSLTPANAGCRYFRVSAGVQECKEVNPADLKGMDRPELDIAELPPETEGKLIRVQCGCNYTLVGSNPLCDYDRSQEQVSTMGTDNDAHPCAAAKTYCSQICPQNID
jgi:hypothetical protein